MFILVISTKPSFSCCHGIKSKRHKNSHHLSIRQFLCRLQDFYTDPVSLRKAVGENFINSAIACSGSSTYTHSIIRSQRELIKSQVQQEKGHCALTFRATPIHTRLELASLT